MREEKMTFDGRNVVEALRSVGLPSSVEIIGKEFRFVTSDDDLLHVVGGTITAFDIEFYPEKPKARPCIALFVNTPSFGPTPLKCLLLESQSKGWVACFDDDVDDASGTLTILP